MDAVALARQVLTIEAQAVADLVDTVGAEFEAAVSRISGCPTRVIVAGIGKSGIIGQKIAATLNSTGTGATFLHPVEAMHGDLGIVDPRDVLIAISYSGETLELNRLVTSVKNRGVTVVAMTGKQDSTLAAMADIVLLVPVAQEACPLGLAPTASTTATLAMGDALAVALLDRKGFGPEDFRRNHPGGSLGERLAARVTAVMLTGAQVPAVSPDTPARAALATLNQANMGAVLVVDADKKVLGIITDGDVRRLLAGGIPDLERDATTIMTANPKTAGTELSAADALAIMQRHEITVLPVVDDGGRLAGIVHLHDLLGKGEFRLLV